jgi:hypothetical protein
MFLINVILTPQETDLEIESNMQGLHWGALEVSTEEEKGNEGNCIRQGSADR